MPEGADEEDEAYAEKRAELNSKINSSEFLNSQVKFKIFIINNENVNAHGFLSLYARGYEVDDDNNIITNSITTIITEVGATGE